jgi:hypothetical protein
MFGEKLAGSILAEIEERNTATEPVVETGRDQCMRKEQR